MRVGYGQHKTVDKPLFESIKNYFWIYSSDESQHRSSHGLMTPSNQPLSEPMLTQVYLTKWGH